jgi:hypothetical protein
MRYRATFITGLAVGFVLGARAGRERYEQMKTLARRATDNPAVQQAAGAAAAQATGLAKTATNKVQQRAPGLTDTARKASERLPGWRDKRAGTGAEPDAGTDASGRGSGASGAGTDGVPSVPAPGGPTDG